MPGSESNGERVEYGDVQQYWVTYGLVGYCGRFRFAARAELQRGQLVLVRSHRGMELGRILWPGIARSDSAGRSGGKAAVLLGGSKPTGDILQLLTPTDPFLQEHHRQVRSIASWLEEIFQAYGEPGVICDLEYVYEPPRLGILYLGLLPETIARLSTLVERHFHTPVEWYDASEWLDADRAWQERLQAGVPLYPSNQDAACSNGGCQECTCSQSGSSQPERNAPKATAYSESAPATVHPTVRAHAGCSACVLSQWFRPSNTKEARVSACRGHVG